MSDWAGARLPADTSDGDNSGDDEGDEANNDVYDGDDRLDETAAVAAAVVPMREQDDNRSATSQVHSIENPIIDDPSDSQTQSDEERLLAPSEACRRRLTEEKGSRDFATQTAVEWPPDLVIPEGSSSRFRVVLQEIDS